MSGLIFDRSGHTRRPSAAQALAEFKALLCDRAPVLPPAGEAIGDGHPVLVFPAFLCSDFSTRFLRRYLAACGFIPYGWEMGYNLGPSDAVLAGTARLASTVSARHQRKASLVGISLGGLFAREAAKRYPDAVRQVVTLCSPFRLPTASTVEPLFRLLATRHGDAFAHLLPGLADAPPVPTAAFFTREDGIVAWESCRDPEGVACQNVEVTGAHSTIARNARALALLARQLARPEAP